MAPRGPRAPALAALLALLLPLAAQAQSAPPILTSEGGTYTLARLERFPVSTAADPGDWFKQTGSSLFLTSGGHALDEGPDRPASLNNNGGITYRLAEASIGRVFSELRPDYTIGDFCTNFPCDPALIDWVKTGDNILNSKEFLEDGSIYFCPGVTNDNQRILFTRGGAISIQWAFTDGTPEQINTYTVAASVSSRPFRIFWTEEPFNGPKINIGNKFIRLLGDPDLVKPQISEHVISTNPYNAVTSTVRGVVFDPDSNTLRAYARCTDPTNEVYDGPIGQFVLAYYDSGAHDKFIGSIVVEVSGPDVNVLHAHVADRVLPMGGGYGIDGLQPLVQKGSVSVNGDINSPYLAHYSPNANSSEDNGQVFAITPTDASACNVDSPWKADVYWQIPDFMDTLWPFEEDWYLVTWNPDDPLLVVGDSGVPGEGLFIPDEYTASLSPYVSNPNASISISASNELTVDRECRFSMRLSTADNDVAFLAFHAVPRTSTNFDLTPAKWLVGSPLVPRMDLSGATAAAAPSISSIDPDLPGYIYPSASTAANWNPDLYHAPTAAESPADDSAVSGTPWDTLPSAIYLVNASPDPVEVWWRASVTPPGLSTPITFPTCPQQYRAVWPDPGDAPEIVLASQLGSAATSTVSSGASLYLPSAHASAEASPFHPSPARGLTFAFWLNPSPDEADAPPPSPGGLVALRPGTSTGTCVRAELSSGGTNTALAVGFGPANAASDLSFPPAAIATDCWTHVAIVLAAPTNSAADVAATLYLDGTASGTLDLPYATATDLLAAPLAPAVGALASPTGTNGAVAVALDGLMAWNFPLSKSQVALARSGAGGSEALFSRLACHYAFDGPSDLASIAGHPSCYATDSAAGGTLASTSARTMVPGAPRPVDGIIPDSPLVAPLVYRQPLRANSGFNPNEEHAFLSPSPSGGWIAWALRNDLNDTSASSYTSDPFVLVQYHDPENNVAAMRPFRVVATNAAFPRFASTNLVGHTFFGPRPLDLANGGENNHNYFTAIPSASEDSALFYLDRLGRTWARRDGAADQFNYYLADPAFDCPSLKAPLPSNALLGWMNCVDVASPSLDDLTNRTPTPWHWTVAWPPDDTLPVLHIGQTLTLAQDGLPEVWNAASIGIAYPSSATNIVSLIDPTVARTAELPFTGDFPSTFGFTVGSSGTTSLRKGKYYFHGLPPTLADRFYVDVNADPSNRMVLVGQLLQPATGPACLQPNILSPAERAALTALSTNAVWTNAVHQLAANGEVHPTTQSVANSSTGAPVVKNDYSPADHYALVANGAGAGHVVLIENDNPDPDIVSPGLPVAMHVLRVDTNLYAGPLLALQDPLNRLSQRLNILYGAPFGDATADYTFEWRRTEPPRDGHVPDDYAQWSTYTNGTALTSLLLGDTGSSLTDLVNTYYAMRYKANAGTAAAATTGGAWSPWCGPTLAEGWVQRVLENVTPFTQRVDDLYSTPPDLLWTMPQQIGAPWQGDVALNDDNLPNIGLLQLYQTVLNIAESMSLAIGVEDSAVNAQLLEAASRLADLYLLLGDDAFSDAANPTLGAAAIEGATSSALYSFANVVPSLLDEELALLRGRTAAVAPSTHVAPFYNRLPWNLTRGVTEGELAYVSNYGIHPTNGVLDVEAAAAQYPLGHGDAYGHYLSALWGYYRLLRNPHFAWGDPAMMEMLLSQAIVNMDYNDEQKFASAAAKLAATGNRVLDLTARKTWRDQAGNTEAGYFDASTNHQAFGYGEWASRTGLGVLANWAVANSLLPASANAAATNFLDQSIATIDRSTVPALSSLPHTLRDAERAVNALDSGLNPLGLDDAAVPLDIDPDELASCNSHFDQMLERTDAAIDNAHRVLDVAQTAASRLASLSSDQADNADAQRQDELAINNKLIQVYGTPYPSDIGPGKTYPQGYDGPDIYHCMWMDLGQYGLSQLTTSFTTNLVFYRLNDNEVTPKLVTDLDPIGNYTNAVTYTIAPNGVVVKPASVTGTRRVEGSIQSSLRAFLEAYQTAQNAVAGYQGAVTSLLGPQLDLAKSKFRWAITRLAFQEAEIATAFATSLVNYLADLSLYAFDYASECYKDTTLVMDHAAPSIVGAGLTINTNPRQFTELASDVVAIGWDTTMGSLVLGAKTMKADADFSKDVISQALDGVLLGADYYSSVASIKSALLDAVSAVNSAGRSAQAAIAALAAAEADFRAKVAEGDALLDEREAARRALANTSVAARYRDMFLRTSLNNALARYDASFDIAQRYTYLLARAYDYDTGLLSSDPQAGDAFLREIVAARALGDPSAAPGQAAAGTDGGLAEIVGRMKANWDILKPRLGINNPQEDTTWFSLRWSLFRIDPTSAGDAAWRAQLAKFKVDNILDDPDFSRLCQPPANSAAALGAEPGFIIPFSTSIEFAQNLFGRPLLGNEAAYSSSDYATKIHSVGIRFLGYNELLTTNLPAALLAANPHVYLVPAGLERMRAPSADRSVLSFNVVDQVLPLPFPIGSTQLDDPTWLPSARGLDGTTSTLPQLRRHSTIPAGDAVASTRLVGRSVWNTRWLLVIPAGALHSDRQKALSLFLDGADSDANGTLDQSPVTDILLGLRTYSRSGN